MAVDGITERFGEPAGPARRRPSGFGGRFRGRIAVVVFAALAVIGVMPAAAGVFFPPDQKHGTYGTYQFNAGVCNYVVKNGADPLTSIKIYAPDLFWPNQTADPAEQGKVSWMIQLYDNGHRIKNSEVWAAIATESTRAPLKARSIKVTPVSGHTYNVWVKAVWYKPDGKVLGSVRHFEMPYEHSTSDYLSWCTATV